MYALASEIVLVSSDPALSKAASRVVDILEGVVDLQIAPAKQLQEARRLFTVLLNHLVVVPNGGAGEEPTHHSFPQPHERRTTPSYSRSA